MKIVYGIISILIMLVTIDIFYFTYKSYIGYVNKKNGSNIKVVIPAVYPILFLLGGLVSVIFLNKTDIFLGILKSCFMFGILFVLAYLNLVVMKRMSYRTKVNIEKLKNVEKKNNEKVFKKKK